MATRPNFDHAWNTFAQIKKPGRMVGEMIGGKVQFNTHSLISSCLPHPHELCTQPQQHSCSFGRRRLCSQQRRRWSIAYVPRHRQDPFSEKYILQGGHRQQSRSHTGSTCRQEGAACVPGP